MPKVIEDAIPDTMPCVGCGKSVKLSNTTTYRLRKGLTTKVFCSLECSNNRGKRIVVKNCEACGKVFEYPASQDVPRKTKLRSGKIVEKRPPRFCSHQCRDANRAANAAKKKTDVPQEFLCSYCGKPVAKKRQMPYAWAKGQRHFFHTKKDGFDCQSAFRKANPPANRGRPLRG